MFMPVKRSKNPSALNVCVCMSGVEEICSPAILETRQMGIVSGGDLLVETAAAVSHALLFFLCNILTIIVCTDCAANSVDVEFFFSFFLFVANL